MPSETSSPTSLLAALIEDQAANDELCPSDDTDWLAPYQQLVDVEAVRLGLELQQLDPETLVVRSEDDVEEPCEFVSLDSIPLDD